jgi:hypothetical protein
MSVYFSPEGLQVDGSSFSAVFVHRESYLELIHRAQELFSGVMQKCPPLVKNSYMLISSHRQQPKNTQRNMGVKVTIKVTDIIYNEIGILISLVYLKKNFTCNNVAHIVLAKQPHISNSMINLILNGELAESSTTISHIETLNEPLIIRGCIGVMTGSVEECPPIERKTERGLTVEYTRDYVSRPETTMTVENPPPTSAIGAIMNERSKFVTFDQFREQMKRGAEEKLRIPLESTRSSPSEPKEETKEMKETYKGYPVMKGPRGGKYYLKDGKRFYLKEDGCIAPALNGDKRNIDNGVVYKISMLGGRNGDDKG